MRHRARFTARRSIVGITALAAWLASAASHAQQPAPAGEIVVQIGAVEPAPVIVPPAQPTAVPVAPPAGPLVYLAGPPAAPSTTPLRPRRPRRIARPYDGGPIPPNAVVQSRANRTVLIAAAPVLAAGYLGSVLAWYVGELACFRSSYGPGGSRALCPSPWLLVPIAGPWLSFLDPTTTRIGAGWFVLSGVVQAGGLGLLIAGIAARHRVLIETVARRSVPRASWALLPSGPDGNAGITLAGAF